jgi:hypothetical protein
VNKDVKVKDNKQKGKGACDAGTAAYSDVQPKITTPSPAFANTFVGCRYATLELNTFID